MLKHPSPDVLQALTVLKGAPQWRHIEEWLRAELSASHDVLREIADDRILRQTQGRAKWLSEFLALAPRA